MGKRPFRLGWFQIAAMCCAALLLAGAAAAQKAPERPPIPREWLEPCGPMPAETPVPPDFSVVCSSGPSHASWGPAFSLEVGADGLARVIRIDPPEKIGRPGSGADPGKKRLTVKLERKVSPKALAALYATVRACRFFELERGYRPQGLMDGGADGLVVQADGKRHAVTVSMAPVTRFFTVREALFAAVPGATKAFGR